jgi:hypothetical protein
MARKKAAIPAWVVLGGFALVVALIYFQGKKAANTVQQVAPINVAAGNTVAKSDVTQANTQPGVQGTLKGNS